MTLVKSYRRAVNAGTSCVETEEPEPRTDGRPDPCQRLGLSRFQHGDHTAYAACFYPILSPGDYCRWNVLCATRYSWRAHEWASYTYDLIPDEVLSEAEQAITLELFHDLWIQTPEVGSDPILVGKVAPEGPRRRTFAHCVDYFLLARWGPQLFPDEHLSYEVLDRHVQGFARAPQGARTALVHQWEQDVSLIPCPSFMPHQYTGQEWWHRCCGQALDLFTVWYGLAPRILRVCGRCQAMQQYAI